MIRTLKNIAHWFEGLAANLIYGYPSRKLFAIGVTGTDGKTTTTSLLHHIFRAAGRNIATITTVGAYIGDKTLDTGFHVTTPTHWSLQKYIKKAVKEGAEYAIVETTSIGLHQFRDWGVKYKVGVLTNITHEHLDYHKTYHEYVKAKAKLFKKSGTSVLNKDDESYKHILPMLKGRNIQTYSLADESADYTLKKYPFKTSLFGDFNKQNCLAAYAAAKLSGIDDETIIKAIATFTPPKGRMETVYDKDFKVIVDFAHTPNSFEKILPELASTKKKRLIHVFGSAAERDESKRPYMGLASSKFADIIILTAEDPRKEPVEKINAEIRSGIEKEYVLLKPEDYHGYVDKLAVIEIPNRKDAIEYAIKMAEPGDTIVTTGKGHENSMNYGHGEEPWSEHETIKDAIKKYHDDKS